MRIILLWLTLICILFSSCEHDTALTNDYKRPLISNGVKVEGGLVYTTDLLGQVITGFRPEDGKIEKQYDFSEINTGPDDLVFMDDGTIYWTSPTSGRVGSIVNGVIEVLEEPGESVNPIERRPGTDQVYFGFESDDNAIGRIDHSTGTIELDVVTNLPSINGFSFAEDDFLYAPLFAFDFINIANAEGGVIRIDVDNDSYEQLEVTFPEEELKEIFKATTGLVADGQGSLYVLESFPPAVYRLDLATLEAFRLRNISTIATDNIALSPDGQLLYVTSFSSPQVFETPIDGSLIRVIDIKP